MNHIALLALLATSSFALAAEAPPMKFEVASVKLHKADDTRSFGWQILPGGKVRLANLPLQVVITFAYNLPFQSKRLTGGPEWIRSERYDVEAVPPEGSIPPKATGPERDAILRAMMQNLLAERFKLVIKRETKELPIYGVDVAKRGLKLVKSDVEEKDCLDATGADTKVHCHNFNGGQGRGLHSEAATIEDAALFVSNWSDRPVVDQTGIKGLYKFDTSGWVPMQPRPGGAPPSPEGLDDPLRPSLFGIFDQLGLKLEARKAPLDMYFVETVERPVEN